LLPTSRRANVEGAVENQSPSQRNYVLRALERFAEYGDREAIVGRGRRLTYADLAAGVLSVAAALRANGVRSGMAVGVLVAHPPEAPTLQLAMHLIGSRSVWIDPAALRREVDDYLRLVPPDVLIYDPSTHEEQAAQLGARLGVPLLCLGAGGQGPNLLTPQPDAPSIADLLGADEPQSVFQTSGTTGVPKSVHHRQALYRQLDVLAQELLDAGERNVHHLTQTPLWHPAGQISALLYLFSGGLLVIMEKFDVGEFCATIERERVSSVFISPPMLYQLLDHPALDGADLSSLNLLSVGSSAAAPDRLRQGVARFGPILRITYGLSECPFISALPGVGDEPEHPQRLRSCGKPYGDVRVEIRGETGSVLGTGQVGEVWVASRMNFAGYWGQPELTAETLVDGWLRTRDLGYVDADGYLHLVGRVQDTIITGPGSRCIYPRPIEDVLVTHPKVRAAAVIGVPDTELGEAVHAFVVPDPDATVTAGELTELVRQELTPVWVPHRIQFVDSLPLTGIGKVNTKALRARYAAEHGAAADPIGTSV
jgi:acyl-CoA synthetase (AMP-forming)/AMP-acid ligase II